MRGDKFDKERLDRYKNEKKVEFLYFHVKDRRKFIQYTNHVAKKAIDNKRINPNVKVNLLKNLSEKYTEETFTQGA